MTRKAKTIIIVMAVLVGTLLIVGGVIYACWHTWINQGPLPIVAGVFEGEMKDNKGEILSYARLEITEISEEEFLSANGVNVIKDASRRRTADYYRLEVYIGDDKKNLEHVEIVGLHYREHDDPNYTYYHTHDDLNVFLQINRESRKFEGEERVVCTYSLQITSESRNLYFSGRLV